MPKQPKKRVMLGDVTYSRPNKTAFLKPVEDFREGLPEMTPKLAQVYAKLLSGGCPPEKAVLYTVPLLPLERVPEVVLLWKTNVHVIEAVAGTNGGAWFDLSVEERMKLAHDKSNSEAAFWLWDTSFHVLTAKEDIEKLKLARTIVKEQLGLQPDDQDPMQMFGRLMLDMARQAQPASSAKKKVPPQLQTAQIDEILGKSRPS